MFYDNYKNIICFDTETTGTDFDKDEIIEFAMLVYENNNGVLSKKYKIDVFVKSNVDIEHKMIERFDAHGNQMSISDLTHIKNKDLKNGVEPAKLAKNVFSIFFQPNTLITGYNIFFDMNMVRGLLTRNGYSSNEVNEAMKTVDYLDFYTIYTDEYKYEFRKVRGKSLGHTLDSAVSRFRIEHKNTHRAIDDTIATWMVGEALEQQITDINKFINVFGYNPKFEFKEETKFGDKTRFLPTDHIHLGMIRDAL